MRFRPRAPNARNSIGQAMVEFVLILPILALLLVMAIDFGRVFFGWVGLHNAARIGADFAGQNPDGWKGSGKSDKQDEYFELVENHVAGCSLDDVDDPVFTDADGDGDPYNWGDRATVTLHCEFTVLTPLAELIVGNPVAITAESIFPVRSGTFTGPLTGGGGGGPEPCTLSIVPYLIGRSVTDAEAEWTAAEFEPGTFTASPNEPDYLVVTQSLPYGACVDPATMISVTTEEPDVCGPGEAQVPTLIGDLVADAKLEWASDFGGAFKPSNAVDTDVVLTQQTDPVADPAVGGCITTAATVTVTWGPAPETPCDVPNMVGSSQVDAQSLWFDAGFETTLKKTGNGPVVKLQDPGHPGTISCQTPGTIRMGS